MDTEDWFSISTFLKENHSLFSVSSIFLLAGISLTTLLLNNLIPESLTIFIQLIVIFCSILYLIISWVILIECFNKRSGEPAVAKHNFRLFKISIKIGDFERAMFFPPYLAIILVYQLYLGRYFAIFSPIIFAFLMLILAFSCLGIRTLFRDYKKLKSIARLFRSQKYSNDNFDKWLGVLGKLEQIDDNEFDQFKTDYIAYSNLMHRCIAEARDLETELISKEELDELLDRIILLDKKFESIEMRRGVKTESSNL